MSVKVMSMVFERYPTGGGERLLALALADHSHDDGTRIFPSILLLSHKTVQSTRTVQYQIRKMEQSGWLIRVSSGIGGKGKSTEYRINPVWINGGEIQQSGQSQRVQKLHPLDVKGCNLEHQRVQSDAPKGATAIAPEPSVTIIEPSGHRAPTKLSPDRIWFNPETNKFYIPKLCYPDWERVFPGLDIDAELDKAELWLKVNPARLKKNYEKFLFGWFSRAVERIKPPPPRKQASA